MTQKISFYGYFFCTAVDCIVCFDIQPKNSKKYLLKSATLDLNYENPTDDITVMSYDNLFRCIAGIIGRFRNSELEYGLYKRLQPVIELPEIYQPLIKEIEESIMAKKIRSFSIFGNPKKYKPQTAANQLLHHMGYFVLATKRPHIYVLEDFIREEYKQLPKKHTPNNTHR